MELRDFQKGVLDSLRGYLNSLSQQQKKLSPVLKSAPELAGDIHIPEKAWVSLGLRDYQRATGGDGNPIPNVCMKVPTGGGKTLLACHSIDSINVMYRFKQTGLVLWIVPTQQIYAQTLKNLRNREHPYREVLDRASANNTLILEKSDLFNSSDVDANLCVLLLMLPSASRKSKETLKVFKDNSGYTSFFPNEEDFQAQEVLLRSCPNLDTFTEGMGIFGNYPLTSLGNVLRLLKPIIILDEGHKAYSTTARETIFGFNPSFLLELSATPPAKANVLVRVSGTKLNDEEMIKLDLHLINKSSVDWKSTISEAVSRRTSLENQAKEYEQNTNVYIRPIMLIQVERTGRDQRDGRFIHAEDAKEYLITQHGIPIEQVAIKSSEKDDIEGIDLLAQECEIRFIITKQALQEGWDCPFAYVLCILSNSQSETAMTQLIGRILRQPYAKKTKVKELDECYIFSYQHDTGKLVSRIKRNLESEGLGDIVGRMAVDSNGDNPDYMPKHAMKYRKKFRQFEGKVYLPIFAIQDEEGWREVRYQSDILARINWNKIDVSELSGLKLGMGKASDDIRTIGYSGNSLGITSREYHTNLLDVDIEYIARQLLDVIPNPWVSYDLAGKAYQVLLSVYDDRAISNNLVFIVEEFRKHFAKEKELLAEGLFTDLLNSGVVKFFLLRGHSEPIERNNVTVASRKQLTLFDGGKVKKNLFKYVPEEDINGLEKSVAVYLESQHQLLWWYRNISRTGYRIQGWRPHRVYPDFIAASKSAENSGYDKVFVLETKGDQLSGNPDTEYKRKLLALCNEQAVERSLDELYSEELGRSFVFEMIDESSWENQLNKLLKT